MRLISLQQQKRWRYLAAFAVPLAGSLLLLPLRSYLSPTDIAMLMLLWVCAMALQFGAVPALLTTLISVLALNWYYVPPYYTLDVHDSANLLSFVVMSVFGLLISYLAARLKTQLQKRRALMSQLRVLYRLASGLHRQQGWPAQCGYAGRVLSRRLACPVFCLPDGAEPCAAQRQILQEQVLQSLVVGAPAVATLWLPAEQLRRHAPLLKAVTDLLWQHWQLQQLQQQNRHQQLAVEREQQRAVLLRSLSHDLRTPLATILGASSMLADPDVALSETQRRQQAENIYQQSRVLHNHFEKVLELSKAQLSSDALQISTFNASDLIAGALARRPNLPAEAQPLFAALLGTSLAATPLAGDLDLLEIALANLLENAARYGEPPAQFRLECRTLPFAIEYHLMLTNQISPQQAPQADSGHGLGLLICRTIASLQQGSCELQLTGQQASVCLRWQVPFTVMPALAG